MATEADRQLVKHLAAQVREVHGDGAAAQVRRTIAALEAEGELDRVAVWEAVLGRVRKHHP